MQSDKLPLLCDKPATMGSVSMVRFQSNTLLFVFYSSYPLLVPLFLSLPSFGWIFCFIESLLYSAGHQWFTPVILATQEAEMVGVGGGGKRWWGRKECQGSRPACAKKARPYLKNTQHKKELAGIPLLGTYPKECTPGYKRAICTPMFIAAPFTIAKLWKQPRCFHDW
jgi:hypothetical protein